MQGERAAFKRVTRHACSAHQSAVAVHRYSFLQIAEGAILYRELRGPCVDEHAAGATRAGERASDDREVVAPHARFGVVRNRSDIPGVRLCSHCKGETLERHVVCLPDRHTARVREPTAGCNRSIRAVHCAHNDIRAIGRLHCQTIQTVQYRKATVITTFDRDGPILFVVLRVNEVDSILDGRIDRFILPDSCRINCQRLVTGTRPRAGGGAIINANIAMRIATAATVMARRLPRVSLIQNPMNLILSLDFAALYLRKA